MSQREDLHLEAATRKNGGEFVRLLASSLGTGLVVLAFLLVAGSKLPVDISVNYPVLSVLAFLFAIIGGAGVCMRPRWVFFGFILACMLMPFMLEEQSLQIGFMRVYAQDVVFVFMVAVLAVRLSIDRHPWRKIPFNRYVWLYLGLGLYGLAIGFAKKNRFDATFGDFRRAFFYFMNYFVALYVVSDWKETRKLKDVLNLGGLLIIVVGAFQLLTGSFYRRRFSDAAHILSHYELTFMSFLLFYAMTRLLFDPGKRRWLWGALAGAATVTTIVGNYRAAWLGMLGGLCFMFMYLPRRSKKLFVLLAALGALTVAVAILALWDVQVVSEGKSTLGEELTAKADVSKTTEDVNVTWRFESYKNAFGLWKESPVVGTGLGEVLEFFAPTSTGGAMLAEGHRVHNSMLWMLMSLGVVGFSVFIFIQWKYFSSIVRYLGSSTWPEGRVTVITCGAFYVSFMISTMFEIFLESAMPITVLTTSMALCVLTIYYTPQDCLPAKPTSGRL